MVIKRPVDLVSLVDLVCFVVLVHLVSFIQPKKPDKRNRPNKPGGSDEQERGGDYCLAWGGMALIISAASSFATSFKFGR